MSAVSRKLYQQQRVITLSGMGIVFLVLETPNGFQEIIVLEHLNSFNTEIATFGIISIRHSISWCAASIVTT